MLFQLLRWWYGAGWVLAFRRIMIRTRNVNHAFSVPILLKTLFAPWKRIISSPGKGIDAKVQAAVDNLVSRMVGFVSRLMVLIAALIMSGGTFVGSVLIAVAWPAIPVLAAYCILRGVL